MAKYPTNTRMGLQTGSANTNSVNEKLSMNTSIAGDFTKIKMQKIMQSNFSQRQAIQAIEKLKPLWNVNQNPKSGVINYKTQQGHQLSKLSTGDPYKKLNKLVEECMQDFQIQQKIKMEESSKKKSPEKAEDGFGIELDSQNDVLNSLNNEEY